MSNSIWITIALYPGCVQGFFLAFVLWQKKEANRAAVGYLVALLLMMALLMLLRVTYQPSFLWRFAEIVLLPDIILFLTGPLIFLMLRALLHLERLSKLQMALHFLPAAFHALVLNTVLGLHLSGYFHFLSNDTLMLAFYLIELGGIISLGAYIAGSWYTWYRYKDAFYQKYSAPFVGDFLRLFFLSSAILLMMWVLSFIWKTIYNIQDYNFYILFWIGLVLVLYLLAYKLWQTPALLSLPDVLRRQTVDALPPPEAAKLPIPAAALDSLTAYMATHQPWLDPDLKIGELADQLGVSQHELSRTINQGLGKNFFDFVNGYRVQAFISQRASTPKASRNTLELAYECGFNSKSAFNRAFKKETGQSPRDFFQEEA